MISLYNLRRACLAGGNHSVAHTSEAAPTADQLRLQALALAADLAAQPQQRWALWLRSPYEFLTAFLALTLAGKHIILPGNMQPGTALLLAPHFDGLISRDDFPGLDCVRLDPQSVSRANSAEPDWAFEPDLTEDVEITLFTSGSTGVPQAIGKRLSLLESELATQQQQWGTALGQTPVISTVSHQHIYGLLHAVLWPFLRQAPFVEEVCQYPEELVAQAEKWPAVVLVSSPTHLTRLPETPVFRDCQASFQAVFSSGGLLMTAPALALAELIGRAPIEILGSTETGGVAWRQQCSAAAQAWTRLPGVVISRDASSGCLAVWSPHLGMEQAYVMGDKIALHEDGSFALLGRADQVVKVEGKRLSITEMERHLEANAWVAAARVAVLQAKREEVGAVLVLTEAGRTYLHSHGKLALNRALQNHLSAYFERPLLPRRWRYVAELPCNSQGKVAVTEIHSILQRAP